MYTSEVSQNFHQATVHMLLIKYTVYTYIVNSMVKQSDLVLWPWMGLLYVLVIHEDGKWLGLRTGGEMIDNRKLKCLD